MKFPIAQLVLATFFTLSFRVQASAVEFDADNIHVIISKADTIWIPDPAKSNASLMYIAQKQKLKCLSLRSIGRFSVTDQLLDDVKKSLGKEGVKECSFLGAQIPRFLQKFKSYDSSEIASQINNNSAQFKALVIEQGNPAELPLKYESKDDSNIGGVIAGVATAVGEIALAKSLGSSTLGATSGVIGSGSPMNIANKEITDKLDATSLRLVGLYPVNFNFLGYERIDAYAYGQNTILIAYKKGAAESNSAGALTKAIITADSFNESIEDIKKARLEDYRLRQSIWDSNQSK
ncbi:hypothetical protein ICN48_04570 [Polynucleobacter sp. JS-Safj-400b-B2]|uniref:hypothetical protein n=1 Tax=Polynucleobacter sp. JS-Safj-400b-B2 TaxID=2576921 RepID=UPI001C0CBE03|nr:hypothetical protein [Polynucleobacter sp. JS-Safj-400b-B2]MBU3625508.1 hypothetical protein [Polynucleobacter sp. JS-Safj-400b-B2]